MGISVVVYQLIASLFIGSFTTGNPFISHIHFPTPLFTVLYYAEYLLPLLSFEQDALRHLFRSMLHL